MKSLTLPCLLQLIMSICVTGAAADKGQREAPEAAVSIISVKRSPRNPLITPKSSKSLGDNLNGPSVIRVPSWVKDPLGKYYMYFAHHQGAHIRLAYANNLHGPWKIHEPGTLTLREMPGWGGM